MIAGVDGCRAGWVVAQSPAWPCPEIPRMMICRDFATVLAATADCAAVAVDMPIGLLPNGDARECDALARKRLGKGATSRVFNTPSRSLLDSPTYREFNLRHRRHFGKGISQQAFGLVPKLREVDTALTPTLQERVREFHPELVWQRLAGRTLPSKHTAEGLTARWKLLRPSVPGLDKLREWRGKAGGALKEDDLLDALAGLELAHRLAHEPTRAARVPENPPRDEHKLRMEIWY